MLGKVRIVDAGDAKFLAGDSVDRFIFEDENARVVAEGKEPATYEPLSTRNYQGVTIDGELHLCGELPGDHEGPHRSSYQRQGRLPPRPQRERHYGTLDSSWNWLRSELP